MSVHRLAPRLIVRRAVVALAVVVLAIGLALAWVETREAPEIQQSRELRIGMTIADVDNVMGPPGIAIRRPNGSDFEITRLIGRWQTNRTMASWTVLNWIEEWLPSRMWRWLPDGSIKDENWPVRVRYMESTGRVVRIERGDEVEESRQR